MRIYHWDRAGKIMSATGIILAMAAASCLGAMVAQKVPHLAVVQQGKALARIVVPATASKPAQDGATLLADYIAKSTGARLEVTKEPAPEDGLVAIHCGATAYVKGLSLDIAKLDPNGFVIAFPDAHHVVLLGAGDTGQEYAAYEFLERYVGVRWLFPGAVGEYVPARPDLTIPAESVRDEPRFKHRLLSGLQGDQSPWAFRNRMHDRINFHHNIWRLFLPEQYGKTHPEFFPVLKGQRFVPQPEPGKTMEQDGAAQCGWQPCFTAPGSAAEAAKNICAYFAKNPQAISYSLGINDAGGHCECPACMTTDGGRKNALGIRDASSGYYAWCNAVARGVNAKYPDKFFGLLAYSGVYSPPLGLRLDKHIVPFITYDRMKWVSAKIQREGHAINEEWGKVAPVLGWYDYIYGGQFYVAPRVYFHTMAEYLRYGYQHNVRHYYAEAYPSADWHEGPKLYVLLKLLWNPDLDVDQLLQDWYTCAVGPAAAPYLAQYFGLWEEFWTKRSPQTKWFRGNSADRGWEYLDFGSSDYMEALTSDDLRHCEELLNKAVTAATNDAERARAKYFLDGFMARKSNLIDGNEIKKRKAEFEKRKAEAGAPPQVKVPALSVPGEGDPLSVDWSKALLLEKWFTVPMGTRTERKPSVRLVHDTKYLYVRLTEPCDTTKLTVGQAIWNGDDWEIFFTVQRDKLPYRQICIGPEGKTVAYEWNNKPSESRPTIWENNARIISDRSNNCWTVNLAFPLEKLLPGGVKAGDKFYANFFRATPRATPKPADNLAWSTIFINDFHTMARCGELTLE